MIEAATDLHKAADRKLTSVEWLADELDELDTRLQPFLATTREEEK